MELFVKCLHNILRHLFCTNIRNLQESSRNIYEKLRSFIRSELSGCILTDHKGVIDLIFNRHDYPDFASVCPILFANVEPTNNGHPVNFIFADTCTCCLLIWTVTKIQFQFHLHIYQWLSVCPVVIGVYFSIKRQFCKQKVDYRSYLSSKYSGKSNASFRLAFLMYLICASS